jgi:hypothetical protein|tara:strand:- start:4201 stop:5502 length:1302 start_codon:yes stop_codon:yes gene_type:complete
MANTIRLKKRASGGASGAPSSLAPSEPAYSEVDNILYYGFGDAGGGAASSVISIAGSGAFTTLTTNQTISGNKTFTGTVDFSGATLSGNTTFSNNLVVTGDLTVNGTTTTVNSTTVTVDDKNIELGSVATPSDTTADGGGITLKGTTDHTITWTNSTDSWDFSEHVNAASGKEFKINGTSVLSSSTLGSGVTGSSLTSVGTIATGTWNGTAIGRAYGGTGLTAAPSNGQLLIGNGTGYTLSTITAGSNVTITNSSGGITIAASGAPVAGDGIDVSGSTVSIDAKANGGLVIESTELAVDLGASSITGTLAVSDGGTGATTASAARTALGLAIGTNVQAYDADLDNLSGCQSGASAALALLTSTEVAILDGATVSTSELNVIDGSTSATSTTLAAADRMVINDAGTMVQVALSDLVTFLENGTASSFELDGGTF